MLSMHQHALAAAEAAMCSSVQNKLADARRAARDAKTLENVHSISDL
jgi:hypothetical protein